jgi:TRAP-type C4-dicarboxylate transport system permease small subunit
MIWMVFVGSTLALRENKHFNVDLFMGKTISRPLHVFLKSSIT